MQARTLGTYSDERASIVRFVHHILRTRRVVSAALRALTPPRTMRPMTCPLLAKRTGKLGRYVCVDRAQA